PAAAINRALAFGVSQSGRFLRTYLYYGFNRDEGNRKVFDGVIAHVAGAGRGSFNHRFAQPSRDGHPYLNFFYPTDIFPFTDAPERDPESGVTDGLLTHAGSPELLPKIFYTNSEYEYWGRADYGPRFAKEGIVTIEPPRIGSSFPILVPQVDADGNGIAGVRMPELAVPLATYTGWNLFNDRSGPAGVLSSMQGSYIPLARTTTD